MKRLLLSLMLIFGALAGAQEPNILTNPTFAEKQANGFPKGWSKASPDGKFESTAEGFVLSNADGKNATMTQQIKGKVESGLPYVFFCRIKAAADTMAQAYVESTTKDDKGKTNWSSTHSGRFAVGTKWQECKFKFFIPENPMSSYLALRSTTGVAVTFADVSIRPVKVRKQFGGYWNLDGLEDSPANGILVPGGKKANLYKLPVEAGKTYRLSYTAQGIGSTGKDYPFHEITTLVTPKVQGAYSFNDVTNNPQPKTQKFIVPKDANFNYVTVEFTPNTSGKVLFTDFAFQEVIPDPKDNWRFFLTEPYYRDIIFNRTDTGRIAGELIVDNSADSAQVEIPGVGNSIIQIKDGKGSFIIPAQNLANGKYPVVCRVYDKAGKELKIFRLTVAKVPTAKSEVIGMPNGYFYINGKPFFPVTQWHINFASKEGYYYTSKNGINSCFYSVGKNLEKVFADFDMADKMGIKFIVQGGASGSTAPDKMETFRERLEKTFPLELRNHPAFLGYFMVDEPLWGGRSHIPLAASYEVYKDFDPYHPTWINAAPRNEVPELRPYAAACDIWGADIYPVPYPNAHSGIDDKGLTSVGKYSARMDECTYGRKPIWMALQGFAWAGLKQGTPVEKHIYPDDVQMRFMALDAMLNKCTGFGLWGTQYIKAPSFYDTIHKTTRELRELSGLFVNGKQNADIPGGDNVRVAVINHLKNRFFFVMNLTDKDAAASFNPGVSRLKVYADGKYIKADANGAFSMKLKPFEIVICGTAVNLPAAIYSAPPVNKEFEKNGNPIPRFIQEQQEKYANTIYYAGKANWIWCKGEAESAGSACVVKTTFKVDDVKKGAFLKIAADDFSTTYVNGKEVAKTDAWSLMVKVDLKDVIKQGENVVLIKVEDSGSLPCGVLAEIEVAGKTVSVSDKTWLAMPTKAKAPLPAANNPAFVPVHVIGPYGVGAWGKRVVVQQ